MKNPGLEERLLGSISQRGIEAPLEGVEVEQVSMLLNGFKRYRCARKLQLRLAPYVSLGQDEGSGIVNRLRISNPKALGILEQAACIDELKHTRPLSLADIAEQLARSKSWVSLRVGLSAPMSGTVRAKLFSGALPAYAYLYLLRRFMRLNGVTGEPVDQFVTAVSGKKLSVREIEQLAHGYFRGPASFRQEILKGNWARPLKQIAQGPQSLDGCSEFERVLLHDLEAHPEIHATDHGQRPGPAAPEPGFSRPGQSPNRRHPEPGAGFYPKPKATPGSIRKSVKRSSCFTRKGCRGERSPGGCTSAARPL